MVFFKGSTRSLIRLIVYLSVLISIVNVNRLDAFVPTDVLRRFEYKLSFKGPHLVFKDDTIPFWEYSGSAIASNDQVRLTPSIRSQKGRIWSKNPIPTPDWEIEVVLRVNGRGRIGADGMAIWYATSPLGVEGPVYGANDYWVGLGVFLDSFDNDAQQNNPYILVMTNDGTKSYDHHRDGITQQLGGCLRDFRNKPFPVRLKIEYYKRVLTVNYHSGLNNDLSNYEICTRIENVDLPANGHFGVSAATGGLADDQDVLSFITHSLIDGSKPNAVTPSPEEQKKFDKEYQEFLQQLESEKERYAREHPDKEPKYDEKAFDGGYDRQFNMILEVQNSIHQSIRMLDSKMAEVLGRQERIVSMVSSSNLANTGGQPQQQQQFQQGNVPPPLPVDTIRREEVNHLIGVQNDLIRDVRNIYASVVDVQQKTNIMQETLRNQQKNPIASQQAGNANQIDPSIINQINDGVKGFRQEVAALFSKSQPRCPDVPSCVTSTFLIIIVIAQTILLVAFYLIKNRSESQMKKFY